MDDATLEPSFFFPCGQWLCLHAKSRGDIGFIDRGSELGQRYESRKAASRFYRAARFYSSAEVAAFIQDAGFTELRFCQTLFGMPDDDAPSAYEVRDGYGAGGFVVDNARNTAEAATT